MMEGAEGKKSVAEIFLRSLQGTAAEMLLF